MLIVTVELWSAITGDRKQLARMHISNDGTSQNAHVGNYNGTTFRGRDAESLEKLSVQRTGKVQNYPRLQKHVWNLVAKMLKAMGYS